jgi:hypothetical protein
MYLTIYADEIGVTARLFHFDYGNEKEPRLLWKNMNKVQPGIFALLTLLTTFAVNLLPVRVCVFFQLPRHLITNKCI